MWVRDHARCFAARREKPGSGAGLLYTVAAWRGVTVKQPVALCISRVLSGWTGFGRGGGGRLLVPVKVTRYLRFRIWRGLTFILGPCVLRLWPPWDDKRKRCDERGKRALARNWAAAAILDDFAHIGWAWDRQAAVGRLRKDCAEAQQNRAAALQDSPRVVTGQDRPDGPVLSPAPACTDQKPLYFAVLEVLEVLKAERFQGLEDPCMSMAVQLNGRAASCWRGETPEENGQPGVQGRSPHGSLPRDAPRTTSAPRSLNVVNNSSPEDLRKANGAK
ncbi:hypothetical protein B0J18DRAFT_193976 [Chaetomium sp. MPI-SDFR-AT-0129]|nr:hypothetical protein B0J18DRAFT_193976 [Chaetomium sp. MPI-SDFR-AT-0129]